MTLKIVMDHSISETAEKTLIVSDNKIIILSDMFEKTYAKTYNSTVKKAADAEQGDDESFGITEFEKKQYYEKVRKEEDNKYSLQGKIGAGGMGAVLKVIDKDLQRPMAMKVVKPSFRTNEDVIKDFIREAKITGLLEHPNIIPVHELGLSEETGLYFTMKLARGESLNHILAEIKKGTPQYVEKYNIFYLLNIFRKICDAISFAHSKGIIHQDIKPHNVIIGQHGAVLVMDWGLARFIGDPAKEPDALRRELLKSISVFSAVKKKIIQGSPAYMAPEQVKGDSRFLDRQTDIFLLGATLYHIFTLASPYQGDDIRDVLKKAENRELIPPQNRNPDRMIPEEMCRIIMKATALKKEDRYPMVQELIDDVDGVIAGKWSRQEKKTFARGQYLMRQGDGGEEAYLIIRGKVQVVKETGDLKVVLSTLSPGEMVGEMALITDEKRSASVEALEDTEVAVLTKQLLAQNLHKLPPYIEKMVAAMTRRLQTANNFIHPHLTRDCSPFVLQQLCLILGNESAVKRKMIIFFDEISARIAGDLGIPVDRVKEVMLKAADDKLLTIEGDHVVIEDTQRILQTASRAKTMLNQ
jgi:serine/threonine-protein kinase